MSSKLRKLNPAVDKRVLIAVSGLLWSGVGVALCRLSVGWLSKVSSAKEAFLATFGVVLALLIRRFGFVSLVDKNISRILSKEGKVCLFGFQPWRSYGIIVVMVGIGIFLRHSGLPKPYLAIVYIGFGLAMFLSSLRYHRKLITLVRSG